MRIRAPSTENRSEWPYFAGIPLVSGGGLSIWRGGLVPGYPAGLPSRFTPRSLF